MMLMPWDESLGPERLVEAWRDAAAEARRWRDDPDLTAALKAARSRLHRPPAAAPRSPEQVLADELRAARLVWAEMQTTAEGPARGAAYANLKRWEPGLFGYSETQRSTAGKIAASEAAEARRDAQERAEAQALLNAFRVAQDRARLANRAVQADPRARALADSDGTPQPNGRPAGRVSAS